MELEAQVEALAPRLLRYCLGKLGERSLAEEVSQEALAALVGRWRRHGPPDSAAAFAFAVARRRAGRLIWRRRLLAPLEAAVNGNGTGIAEGDCGAGRAPDALYAARERLERTLAALAVLPARERDTLLLVAVGEVSTSEAARILGVSRSAIKMRVHRARGRLLRLMEEDDDE